MRSALRETHVPAPEHDNPWRCELRLKGRLDDRWADWFEGPSCSHASDGTTILSGPVVDLAALHGLLKNVRDVGLPLLSVMHVEPDPAERPESTQPRR